MAVAVKPRCVTRGFYFAGYSAGWCPLGGVINLFGPCSLAPGKGKLAPAISFGAGAFVFVDRLQSTTHLKEPSNGFLPLGDFVSSQIYKMVGLTDDRAVSRQKDCLME
jgi:hypothetical protein